MDNPNINDEQVNMDAILNAALDELDDDENDKRDDSREGEPQNAGSEEVEASATKDAVKSLCPSCDDNDLEKEEMDDLSRMIQGIFSSATNGNGNTDEAFGAMLTALQRQMATELECIEKEETERKKTPSSNQNSDSTKIDEEKTGTRPVSGSEPPPKSRPVFGPEPPPPKTESDVDRTINKLLNDMTSATKETGDDFSELDDVMKELMGDGGDDLIDGMMQQLLTKELMYEPIKQVASKFPQWLKDKKGSLTEEEYNNRCKQLQHLQELIQTYEKEPENTAKLMDLMKDVQEYGLPPAEIITEIAPDMELDEKGVPKLGSLQDCSLM